jgi:FkbM family methyltransferase
VITLARRAFYNAGGPWYRNRVFEALGSDRYAQPALFDMDVKLAEVMPWQGGTFVEAGAHDGYTQSNTYWLERRRGWTGVLVEPIPELARRCSRRRPRSRVVNCALVASAREDQTVRIEYGDLMSAVGDADHAAGGLAVTGQKGYSVDVPARTLSSILDEAGLEAPDVIILDVEGNELEALRGLDMDRHAPRWLLLESLDPEAHRPGYDAALTGHFQFDRMLSPYDLLYRRA